MKGERSASKIVLSSVDDLFKSTQEPVSGDSVIEIPLPDLHTYVNHHFKVVDDGKMQQLVNSIAEEGLLNPIIVRPRTADGYEILSGHRRKRACEINGMQFVPAIVRELDDEAAELFVIESNIQREKMLPSELAWSLKREFDIRSHAGKKGEEITADIVGRLFSLKTRKVHRVIRLTELIPELLDILDAGKIGSGVGEILSYLNKEEQHMLYSKVNAYKVYPSLNQAEALKEASKDGTLTDISMDGILSRINRASVKVDLDISRVEKYLDLETSTEERQEIIYQALKEYWERRQVNVQ